MAQLRQAQRERDIARNHRDRALKHFDESMSLLENLKNELAEVTRMRNRAVGERDREIYEHRVTEGKLRQIMHDYRWIVEMRQRTVSEREMLLKTIEELKHDRNKGWDSVARLKAELDLRGGSQRSLIRDRQLFRHAPLSHPIVSQRKAARRAQERNSLLKKQKLV